MTANEDVQLWAACTDGSYYRKCNNIVLNKGESATFPSVPVGIYDEEEGPHFHIRKVAPTPHTHAASPWDHMPLTPCTCVADEVDHPYAA